MRSTLRSFWRPGVAALLLSATIVTSAGAAPATVKATRLPQLGSGVVAMDGTNAVVGGRIGSPASYVRFFHEVGSRWVASPMVGTIPTGPNVVAGTAVALSGNDAVVASVNTKTNVRLVYFFQRVGSVWHLLPGAFTDPNHNPRSESRGFIQGHYFALGVSLGNGWAFVGEPGSVGGGSVVVYRHHNGWHQVAILSDPRHVALDSFGSSVAITPNGTTALVGALNVSAAKGQPANDGVAYVLHVQKGSWTVTQTLHEPSAGPDNLYGATLAVSNTNAIVGAFSDSGPGQHIGNEGAVYCYRLDGTGATLTQVLNDPKEVSGDLFGGALAISGSRVIVAATGVFSLVALRPIFTGAAYLYDLNNPGTMTTVIAPNSRSLGSSVAIGTRDAWMLANGITLNSPAFIVDARA